MNRDEPCHNRGGTVDNLGDPGGTVLNRLMSPVVLKCLNNRDSPGVTEKAVKYRGKLGRRRKHPCLHRDKPCAMKTPGMPDFSTMWYVPTTKPQISLRLGAV